jgi:hypothetical protein
MALIVVLTLLLFAPSLQAQTTRHVDDDAPGDPGPGDTSISDPLEDGTADHPFDAIQEGINAAVYGDTVLVADGLYTGEGNRDMSFLGKAITVASAGGPAACIIDGEGSWSNEHNAFLLNSGEGPDSVLRGFTIRNFMNHEGTPGIYCRDSSPTILGNVLRDNEGYDTSAGLYIYGYSAATESSPLVIDNVFTGNYAESCSGILIGGHARPLIFNNLLYDNTAYPVLYGDTGAIYCYANEFWNECEPLIVGCSIVGNHGTLYSEASGIWVGEYAHITVIDSIVYGNEYGQIDGNGGYATVSYSDVEGFGGGGNGNIGADPLFTSGPKGDYYLSQVAAGQPANSPCLDAASDLAENVCAAGPDGDTCLGDRTTRSDGHLDAGQADMGYHYAAFGTVGAWLTCLPSVGTLPFQTRLEATMENRFTGITRRMAARINVELANGQGFSNWRAGFTNIGPDGTFSASWMQTIPALASLVGDNRFTLAAEDVTPAPYNQPPYAPSGDTARNGCTVTGAAP